MSEKGAAGGGMSKALPGWDQLARAASQPAEGSEDHGMLRQLLRFDLDGTPYAIPVERVREIVRIRPITPIPGVPDEVRGVISLRGEIVQVVDLRRRLRLAPARPTRSSRIIVVHGEEEGVAGILVDSVSEVLRISEEAIRPVTYGESEAVEALCKRGEQFVSLVDVGQVLGIHAGH